MLRPHSQIQWKRLKKKLYTCLVATPPSVGTSTFTGTDRFLFVVQNMWFMVYNKTQAMEWPFWLFPLTESQVPWSCLGSAWAMLLCITVSWEKHTVTDRAAPVQYLPGGGGEQWCLLKRPLWWNEQKPYRGKGRLRNPAGMGKECWAWARTADSRQTDMPAGQLTAQLPVLQREGNENFWLLFIWKKKFISV